MKRQSMIRSIVLALAVASVPSFAATTQPSTSQAADLPVKSVTLYTSGVGFFRHEGVVAGDGSATLKFKTAQINDVLKSLIVQDAGGTVTGVQYPSQDPLDKTLKTFQIDLTGDPTMASLFSQLRGAKVSVQMGGEVRTGTVLGVEKRTVPAMPTMPATETAVLNLFDGTGIGQIELNSVRSITLQDPALQAELNRALAAVAAGRDQDKKPVTIHFTGGGEHRLHLGYVVETPVWKTAYRLLLKDPAGENETEDRLQGWAVVENQTDADWNDVTLSLVSGRPISFVMDLYQPQYLQRPVVAMELFQGLKPQIYYRGQNSAFHAKSGQNVIYADGNVNWSSGAKPAAPAPIVVERESSDAHFGGGETALGYGSAVQSAATTARLGELFQYTIEHVTLPRQQSSLVPIVTDKIEVEPMSIYNETVLPRNPLTGVMLTNSTGKLLPQGPITVLSGGAYAGDARIEDLPAGQKRLLSFGVDLETLVDVKSDAKADLIGGKIVKGVLRLNRKVSQGKAYAVENKGDKDRTVVVEHMLLDGWDLIDTPEPMETTDKRYRFKIAVAKGNQETLKVTQQQVQSETIAVLSYDLGSLMIQSRQGALPQKVKDALAEVIKRRQALIDLERHAKDKADQVNAISTEQTRLRENMKVVDKGGDYYARLMTKLNKQESRIETLQKERDELDAKGRQTRSDFEAYLDALNVE